MHQPIFFSFYLFTHTHSFCPHFQGVVYTGLYFQLRLQNCLILLMTRTNHQHKSKFRYLRLREFSLKLFLSFQLFWIKMENPITPHPPCWRQHRRVYMCVCVACVCMRVWQCVCALRNNKHSYKQIQGRVLQKIQSHYSLHYLFFCTHHHSFKCLRFLLMLCLLVAISRASVEVNKKKVVWLYYCIPLK